MSRNLQLFCALCGWLFPLSMFGGASVAGLFSGAAFSPMATAGEVAAYYQQNAYNIRIGMVIFMLCGALYGMFTAVIAVQTRRIEHNASLILCYAQILQGGAAILLLIIPSMICTTAAFRPERAPEITQALHDLAWFFFAMPFVTGTLHLGTIGLAMLIDKGSNPIFPHWLGYLTIAVGLSFAPGFMVTFYKAGPFAWDGFAFKMPAIVWFPWLLLVPFYVIKAARRQATVAGG